MGDSPWTDRLCSRAARVLLDSTAVRSVLPSICLVALFVAPRPAFSVQGPRARLAQGARVRFDAPSQGGYVTGTLLAFASDTLVVQVDGDAAGLQLIVHADSVNGLEVRRERRMALEGLGIGLLTGTLLAAVASPDIVDDNGNCTIACLAYKVSPRFGTRVKVLGGVGALVGLIIGSETRHVSWAPVQLERVDIGPAPGGGISLGIRLSF